MVDWVADNTELLLYSLAVFNILFAIINVMLSERAKHKRKSEWEKEIY